MSAVFAPTFVAAPSEPRLLCLAPDVASPPSSASPASPSSHAPRDQVSLHDTVHPHVHGHAGDTLNGRSLSGHSLSDHSHAGHAPATSHPSESLYDHAYSGDGPRIPKIPQIGLDEHVYARMARKADEAGDRHAREAAKVGLYVTLALNPKMPWKEKLRHFEHAIQKHCHCEAKVDHRLWAFYHALCNVVREHCGNEALRLASEQDDRYAARLAMGQSKAEIRRDAIPFFESLTGREKGCPSYMREDEFSLIRMIRQQWT